MKIFLIAFFLTIQFSIFSQTNKKTLYPYQADNLLYGFKNRKGKLVLSPSFQDVREFVNNLGIVKKDNKWGVINEMGYFVISNQYDTISFSANNNVFLVGKINIPPDFISIHFKTEMFYGLVSISDKSILPVQFEKITQISKDSFNIKNFEQWILRGFSPDTSICIKSNSSFVNKGVEEIEIDSVPLQWDWRIPVKPRRTWGFLDSAGLMRISNQYENVKSFSENLAAIKFQGKWGFIDKYENIIIQPNYDFVSRFENGICVAEKKSKYGLLNKSGREITPFEFNEIISSPSGLYITRKNNREGVINKEGKEILAPRFEKVFPQEDQRIIVLRSGKKGLMNEIGSFIYTIEYDDIVYIILEKKYLLHKKVNNSIFVLKKNY